MEKKNITNFKAQFSVIGFLLGLLIISIIYASALASNQMVFTFKNIFKLHGSGFYFIIIDLIPVFVAITAFVVGHFTNKIALKLADLEAENEKKSGNILDFVENLTKGNLDTNYDPTKDDSLGKILINLRNSLKNNHKEEEQRKKEDDQRNWIAEGLAKFGEILRHNNDNIETLSYELISNICRYIGAVQGGFFIINDELEEDKFF